MGSFVHLHVHTEYSLLDSLVRLGPLMDAVADLDMPGVAMTDTGVLYGAPEFHRRAKAKGLRPVLGVEMEMAPRPPAVLRPLDASGPGLVLLAETQEGWGNLLRLVSDAHLSTPEPGRPVLLESALAQAAGGLIGLSSGGNGEINRHCAAGRIEAAVDSARRMAEIFGPDRFFLELQHQGLPGQDETLAGLREVARRTGLPTVATNNVHYLHPGDARAHEILRCARRGAVREPAGAGPDYSRLFHLRTAAEMTAALPADPDAVARSAEIAMRCTVDLWPAWEHRFPRIDPPADFEPDLPRGREAAWLRRLAFDGLRDRCGVADPAHPPPAAAAAVARLGHELETIIRVGFVNYLLVVWDIVRFARERGIPIGPGRGAVAGSLAAYCLGITDIDPIRHDLPFERFLNSEKPVAPDIDLEICPSCRPAIVAHLRERHGRDRVAHIVTFGTFGARMAIRDTGRALGVSPRACDDVVRRVPDGADMTIARAIRMRPDLRREAEAACAPDLLPMAQMFEGLPRNPGTHPTGVVLAGRPLVELVPLALGGDRETVTQYDMHELARAGLLKIDLPGLRVLTVLDEAVRQLRGAGVAVDLAHLPEDDPATLALLNRGDTIGIFQLDGASARAAMRRAGIGRFEDLVALLALHRPDTAPLLDEFIARKRGELPSDPPHKLLRATLEATHGLLLYQEQIPAVAAALAGFSPEKGDLLRRFATVRDEDALRHLRPAFAEAGRRQHRLREADAARLFSRIEDCGRRGISRAHAIASAELAYRAAWLKAHHPVEFLAAAMSNESGDTARVSALSAEARTLGIPVLGPDANRSAAGFVPEGRAIRFGLAGIRGVGPDAARAWAAERDAHGPFGGLVDFCRRAAAGPAARHAVECLIRCGAFDFTGMPRSRMAGGLDLALAAAGGRRDVQRGQGLLFDESALGAADDSILPPSAPWPDARRIEDERELLGYPVTAHPISRFEWFTRAARCTPLASLSDLSSPGPVRVAGLALRAPRAGGGRGAAPELTLDMPDGSLSVTLPPDVLARDGAYTGEGKLLYLEGRGMMRSGTAWMTAVRVRPLEQVVETAVREMQLHVPPSLSDAVPVDELRAVLVRHPGDVPVTFVVMDAQGGRVVLETGAAHRVHPSESLVRGIEGILGESGVALRVE
ncbi:MAG: DNA polymerase III subunit alpha [Verrucomicrobia bacterium]|nr:DNA polymerase III subunit alpha [Verrucomicrobiota bacterium]